MTTDPKTATSRVNAIREGMLGVTLGDTEHVMKLNDARLLAREIARGGCFAGRCATLYP